MKKKEQWEVDYEERVKAIRKAIGKGHKFFLDTYLGKLEVKGIDAEGSWAYTGEDFSSRSWAICSSQVYPWAKEIGIPDGQQLQETEVEK